ncbi:hypothetical protein, partial [Aeromonas sp. QDB01]|uniref:hypothetical protein n=1 Tax=Aeromonas sp. QDB01 TaxID=2990475 RepID=UPI0022DFE556
MNTLGGHDGVIDESLNSHRWVGSGWCNLISPPSRPATVFFCLFASVLRGYRAKKWVHRGFPGKAALIFRKKYSESLNPYA